MDTNILETEYLQSLSQKEIDAYKIAKSMLGSSFSLFDSCGFIQWCREEKENEKVTKTETKTGTETETKTETKAETETETETEKKAETETEQKAETETETNTEPEK